MKAIIRRVIFYVVLILVSLALQTVIVPSISVLQSVPNFFLITVTSIAILRGRREGMIIGLICGLLCDFSSGSFVGFYAIIYLWIGYINGLLSHFLADDMVLVPMGAVFANELIYSAYVYVFRYLIRNRLDVMSYIHGVMMPELVQTVVLSMFLYWIIMTVNEILETRDRRGERRFA